MLVKEIRADAEAGKFVIVDNLDTVGTYNLDTVGTYKRTGNGAGNPHIIVNERGPMAQTPLVDAPDFPKVIYIHHISPGEPTPSSGLGTVGVWSSVFKYELDGAEPA
jgi:hypothetical protein